MKQLRNLNFSSFPAGFFSRTADLHPRVPRPPVPHQHVLPRQDHRRAAAVYGRADNFHQHRLPNGRFARRVRLFCHRLRHCVTRGKRGDIVRILDILCQQLDFDGTVRRPARHNPISDFRRLFPQRGLGAIVLRVAVLFVLVPLWKRSAAHQSVDGSDRHRLHALEHDLPIERKNYLGNAQLRSGE